MSKIASFWDSLLDGLEDFLEVEQDVPGLARGKKIRIISGTLKGRTGTVEATVFQNTVDYPDELAHGYHVTLDDGTWVTVRVSRW